MIVLQIIFIAQLGIVVCAVAVWSHFAGGGGWWLVALAALLTFLAIVSELFLGEAKAWRSKAAKLAFAASLSTRRRAIVSNAFALPVSVLAILFAFRARPVDPYFEVRVYDQVDLPGHRLVGAKVTLHTRTDGLTHLRTVLEDGGAVFQALVVPTTLTYQLEVQGSMPFLTGGGHKVDRLPDQLSIDIATIPAEKRQSIQGHRPLRGIVSRPRYLATAVQRGDATLQAENAPWGVPDAPIVINRLSYVLGYNTEGLMPRWVAYSIMPATSTVERMQFESDPALGADLQAGVADYRGSGFDRGHLISPSDMHFRGPVGAAEAWYMTTVAPQTPWLNRGPWARLEQRVREVVGVRGQPAFIVAGPLFIAPSGRPEFVFQTIGERRIPVPTHFFRIIATQGSDGFEAVGVMLPNATDGSREWESYIVPIRDIERASGLDFFPLLDPRIAERAESERGQLLANSRLPATNRTRVP